MNTYVLMGGKDADQSKDFNLEIKILNALKVTNPKILWVGFANWAKHQQKKEEFETIKRDFPCELEELKSLEEVEVKEKVAWADIIYFCGGNANQLIQMVRGSSLEQAIKDSQNKIWMGISAGGMLFCKAGMGDRYAYLDKGQMHYYQMVDGLDILPLTFCPHYNHNGLWCYNDEVCHYPCDGVALEDGTAIILQDHIQVIKYNKSRSVYLFDASKDYLMISLYEDQSL